MDVSRWESYYQQAYERGLKKIRALRGVACAFHSVIDGIVRVTPEVLDPLFQRHPELKEAAKAGVHGEVPLEIMSSQDFVKGLFCSLSKGAAMQRMIRSEETYQWAMNIFGPGELRLGGTSGNMARSLAPLGIPVTVYADPLTRELAELFGDSPNLKVITKEDHHCVLKTPKEAVREQGIFAIHWILEYGADFEYSLDDVLICPRRANRYIPSWNPRNNQFRMNPEFAHGFMELLDSYSHLLFSGFHILSERYPDGSTCEDVVKPLGDYLEQVNERSQELKIHLEFASIASHAVRAAVLKHIVPHVHSLGLNETELPLLLENLGEDEFAQSLRSDASSYDFCQAAKLTLERTSLERIHFHNLGYYLCLEKEPWHSSESSRDALLFAAVMAAARAKNGLFQSLDDIAAGKEETVSQRGLEELNLLADQLAQPSIREQGIAICEGMTLTAIPAKLVENPLFTVGLGDTISSGAFLTE